VTGPEASIPESHIRLEDVASAERLIGLTFTEAERLLLLENVQGLTKQYEKLRALRLDNAMAPALVFQPFAPARAEAMPRSYRMSRIPPVTRPANLEAAAFLPLTHLAELIRTRQVTSLELTEMYLQRLKRYYPFLHCVVTITEELALAQAKAADAEIQAGHYRGPLHGIPWGVKDLFAVRGYPTTWGAEPYRDHVIDADATVVKRLEAAGAVLVAKLTLGALAMGDVCFDTMTRNPWNIDEGSRGSSAGSASAVAAGLVGFAIGTETFGSIVSPSNRCGTTRLRPTYGRISRDGAMALCWSMDKIGPMARSVEDCALIFSAIYGPDGQDAAVIDVPFEWNPDLTLDSLKIGYIPGAFENGTPIDQAALEKLRAIYPNLIPIELPEDDPEPLLLILHAEAAAAFDELTLTDQDDRLTRQDKQAWPNQFRSARFITAVEYIQANRFRARLMQKMAEVMRQVDVFVAPSFADKVLMLTNFTGHPAVVLPSGFSGSPESPSSITFTGTLYGETALLAAAKAFQEATDFHQRHPVMNYAVQP
jgi:Asp-tRNA(Asn)/Glu-tRNA(Gln) amidotransferase A subunit family amidase